MSSPQFPLQALNVPQNVLDHYNGHYNNDSYRAFREALAAGLPGGEAHPDHTALMNMLIDSAFERSGAELYRGASVRLGAALVKYQNLELFALAEQHLRHFDSNADETVLTAGLLHMLETLHILAESGARAASDHHGWRGRVVFWWLSAIAHIAQAAHAVLSESHNSYVQEKLAAGARYLRDGVSEGAVGGLVMAYPIMNWFTRFPLP